MNTRIYLYLIISMFTFAGMNNFSSSSVIKEDLITSEVVDSDQLVKIEKEKVSDNSEFNIAPSLKEKAHLLFKAAGFADYDKIRIVSHDDTSCSDDKTIWMNSNWELGPQDYVLAHECGHIVCGHYKERCNRDVTDEEMRAQEKEADLMACKLLCDLNLPEIVEARIAEIQYAIDQKWKQSDTNDHPTLQEMVDYIRDFLNEYKK